MAKCVPKAMCTTRKVPKGEKMVMDQCTKLRSNN